MCDPISMISGGVDVGSLTTKAVTEYDKVLETYQQMSKEDLDKFEVSPTERYDNAMRHLKTAIGIASITQNIKKFKEFSDMINKIDSLKRQR